MRIYSTSQVAKICQVASRTVCQWFDDQGLNGYRLPGSNHRRIPHNSVVEFLAANGMPSFGLELESDVIKEDAVLFRTETA